MNRASRPLTPAANSPAFRRERAAVHVVFSRWWIPAGMALAIAATAAFYLWPSYAEFPMDDAYIHLVYAENLAEHGELFFNTPDEKGVGTSSILWVLLIAAGHRAGLPASWLMKGLGVGSLIVVGVSLFFMLSAIWRPATAVSASLLVTLSGNMLWFALNGMETMLFLALGLVALWLYRAERWAALGVTLGLLTLTRPEGLALLLAVNCVELVRHLCARVTAQTQDEPARTGALLRARAWQSGRLFASLRSGTARNILVTASACLGISGLWFGYLLGRTGQLLPTSGTAKQLSNAVSMGYVLETAGGPAILGDLLWLIYVVLWLAYLLVFVLGGMSFPSPRLTLGGMSNAIPYAISWWSLLSWAVAIVLLVAACRHVLQKARWSRWLEDGARRPLAVLFLWVLGHNVTYMVFLPMLGTATRYGALNHVMLWLLLVLGLMRFGGRRHLLRALSGCLLVIALANTIYWNRVYDANLEHMVRVRIEASHYLRDAIPATAACAASDVGALRYHGERPIVDLGGLIDPQGGRWFSAGAVDRYLVAHEVTCLALPGRSGARDEGMLHLAEILGLNTSPLFALNLTQVFEIDHARWLLGYLPTMNYQASVAIYHLIQPESPKAVRRPGGQLTATLDRPRQRTRY